VPLSTMLTTAFQPFGDRSFVGQMKLPAALLTSQSTRP